MIGPITNAFPVDTSTKFEDKQPSLSSFTKELKDAVQSKAETIEKNDKALKEVNKNEESSSKDLKVDFKNLSDQLKNILQDKNLSLEFTLDKDTKKMVMRIINESTKEVIQQFPDEVALKIARIVSSTMELGTITNVKV
jgi:uncharacterized FlaG/YvyC family protein